MKKVLVKPLLNIFSLSTALHSGYVWCTPSQCFGYCCLCGLIVEPWHQSTRLSRPFVAWRALCPRLCCCTTIQPCLIGRFPFLKTSQRYCTKVTGLPRSHQAHESLRCCAAVLHINPALHGLVYHQVNCWSYALVALSLQPFHHVTRNLLSSELLHTHT